MPIGEAAACKVADRLSALSLSTAAFTDRWNRQRGDQVVGLRTADEVRINGLRVVNPRFVELLIDTRQGQSTMAFT